MTGPKLKYCVFQDIKTNMMGVISKIQGQTKYMARYFDAECAIIGRHDRSLVQKLDENPDLKIIQIPRDNIFSYRLTGLKKAYSWIKSDVPEFMYLRYPLACPLAVGFLKKVKGLSVKVITEHQAIEPVELLMSGKKLFAFSDRLFGGMMLKSLDAMVTMTDEIRDFEASRAPGIPILVNGNGIDPELYPLRDYRASKKAGLDILFIGALASWHGLDLMIEAMRNYTLTPITLHIAGEGPEMTKLKSMAETLPKMHMVKFYGYLDREAVKGLFDSCDVALGSLALDRENATQGSILKNREYGVRGIPIVINHLDSDFKDVPWVLRLAPGLPDLAKVVEWAENLDVTPDSIRSQAVELVGYDVKMKKLRDFLISL